MIYINLLDYRDIYRKIVIKKQIVGAIFGILLSFFCIFGLISNQNNTINNLNSTITTKQSVLNVLKAEVRKVTEFEKKEAKLKEMLKVVSLLKQKQSAASIFLDELNKLITAEVWITNLSENNSQISLNGYSFSNQGIANFMKRLEISDYFKTIELIGSEQSTIGSDKVKKFTVRFNVNVNALRKKI